MHAYWYIKYPDTTNHFEDIENDISNIFSLNSAFFILWDKSTTVITQSETDYNVRCACLKSNIFVYENRHRLHLKEVTD